MLKRREKIARGDGGQNSVDVSDSIQRSAATVFKKTGKVISLYHRKFG
jgi:hypothetical protein